MSPSDSKRQGSASDKGSCTVVELHGVAPEEIPYDEENPARYDEARQLANDIYRLIQEDYGFTVDGVATRVNRGDEDG